MEEEQAPAPLFDWRAYLVIHPAAEVFPLMKDEDPAAFARSVDDIKANGLVEPIAIWWSEDNKQFLLDGRNRFDALAQLGLLFETPDHHIGLRTWDAKAAKWALSGERIVFRSFHGGDPYKIALSLNLHRRHLTSEQKRDLIAKVLKARPEISNLQIAQEVKADDKTVGKVRAELEARSEIPNVHKRTDSRGRKQPAKRSKRSPRHQCWQCGARAPVGEVQQHNYAACGKADVWLHDGACVAAFEAQIERDRQEFADDDPAASAAQRRAQYAAADDADPSAGNGAGSEPTEQESLAAKIQLEWSEAAAAFENLTSHAVTQIANAIPYENRKEAANRATEYANLFQALAAQLATNLH